MGANCQVEQRSGGKVQIKMQASPPTFSSTCLNPSVAERDTKGMINHRLLAACRDDDLVGMWKAIDEGAYLETRRPFVMRPKPPGNECAPKKRKVPTEGLTPLMYSAQNGSLEGVRMLLRAKADVKARDEDGTQPLHLAASAGAMEVCQLLLLHGADREVADEHGRRGIDYVPKDELHTKAGREKWEAVLHSDRSPEEKSNNAASSHSRSRERRGSGAYETAAADPSSSSGGYSAAAKQYRKERMAQGVSSDPKYAMAALQGRQRSWGGA